MQVNHAHAGVDNELITSLRAISNLGEKEMNTAQTDDNR